MQMFIISINQNVMRSVHRISTMRISTRKEEQEEEKKNTIEFEFTNSYDFQNIFHRYFVNGGERIDGIRLPNKVGCAHSEWTDNIKMSMHHKCVVSCVL